MTLRLQLLLVSLSLLGIPWTGLQFLKANEQALRTLQQQALESTALAIASGLNDRVDMLYSSKDRLAQVPSDNSLQVQSRRSPPIIDGAFDEWFSPEWRQFGTDRRPVYVAVARTNGHLFIALRAFDDTKTYNTGTHSNRSNGDRVVITTWHNQTRESWVVSPAAPGDFARLVPSRGGQLDGGEFLRGHWIDVADGYQLELAVPISSVGERLGITYVDVDEGGESYRGNVELAHDSAPPWLVLTPPLLESFLDKFSNRSMQIRLVDRWGWELGQSTPPISSSKTETHGLTQWLYRSLLPTPLPNPPSVKTDSGRWITGSAAAALQNNTVHRLINNGETLVAQFAAPISSENSGIIGAVVVEQAREEYLSLTDSAFERLFYKGTLAMLAVILALLGYAGLLSLRILRLNAAIANGEAISGTETGWFDDEIAGLTQQFQQIRGEQQRLENYLRSLPRALAHEIRTPVAVISSTLENIESAQTNEQRTALVQRAKSGLTRLSNMLNAMNEATRLEASVGREHYEMVDLVTLLAEVRDAYQQTFERWSFELDTEVPAAVVSAVPELLVQALDKLIANATSFTQPGGTIRMVLAKRGIWWRLSVRNPGPLLPDAGEALFAPMRSIREREYGDEQHVGLGLYMVSLIAQHHGGEPFAKNTDNPTGAEVGFSVAMG